MKHDNSYKVKLIQDCIKWVKHLSGNVKRYVYIVKYYCKYLYDDYILLNVKWIKFLRIRTKRCIKDKRLK